MPGGAPLIVAVLSGIAVLLIFMALWLFLQRGDEVEERLEEYGLSAGELQLTPVGDVKNRYTRSWFKRFLAGFGLGPNLALTLTQADVPMTAAEFLTIVLALAIAGFVIGTLRFNALLGLALAVPLALVPFLYLRIRQRRRLRQFTQQLPDMLTLIIGGLRAGYGLNQALDLVVDRLGDPAATEMGKVVRAVNLGIPLQQALNDAVARLGSEDFNLVVVAINVHYETGGNLAETLEIISDTVRDRLYMLNEIRVLTAQQRFTGYVLGALPVATGLLVFFVNPEYIMDLFQPGWVRVLPIAAVGLQILGFLFIRRIVDIEV
ncbi:MAG: type II secretion system F family protein [Anaerolineae bacterium]